MQTAVGEKHNIHCGSGACLSPCPGHANAGSVAAGDGSLRDINDCSGEQIYLCTAFGREKAILFLVSF